MLSQFSKFNLEMNNNQTSFKISLQEQNLYIFTNFNQRHIH